jgi:hypothetical protein
MSSDEPRRILTGTLNPPLRPLDDPVSRLHQLFGFEQAKIA